MIDVEVKKIDKVVGKIILLYGLLVNFNMLVMIMVFLVKDVGLLDWLKVGDKVCFRVE